MLRRVWVTGRFEGLHRQFEVARYLACTTAVVTAVGWAAVETAQMGMAVADGNAQRNAAPDQAAGGSNGASAPAGLTTPAAPEQLAAVPAPAVDGEPDLYRTLENDADQSTPRSEKADRVVVLASAPKVVLEVGSAAKVHDGNPGTYRTYCVRLCDGSYRPMSFSTASDKLKEQAAACRNSCDTPARLFVHANPGGSPASMVSMQGLPYAKLETAFLFRTRYDSSCACKANPWEQASKNRHQMYALSAARKKGNRSQRKAARVAYRKIRKLVEAERKATRRALRKTNRVADSRLAALVRKVGAVPLVPKKRKTVVARVRKPLPPGRMSLGYSSQSSYWGPGLGNRRHWANRAFDGN